MILLVLVVVLWICVLAPSLYRRFSEKGGVGSIDHFHRQLTTLEHAGPKLVSPAYRLHTATPSGAVDTAAQPEETPMYRAKLVLLRPTDDEASADIDDTEGTHYERVGVLDPPEPVTSYEATQAELAAYRRQEARRRTSNIVLVLVGLTLSTLIIGFVPSMRFAWIFTAITGLMLGALIALIAYAREIERLGARRGAPPVFAYDDAYYDDVDEPYLGGATAGYPGAWDDEYADFPDQAAASG